MSDSGIAYAHYDNKGLALSRLGKFTEALECHKKSFETGSKDREVNFTNTSMALGGLGRHEEAIENCEKALEIDPNRPIRDSYRATRLLGRLAQNQIFHENEEAVCIWNVKRQPNKSKFKIRALDYFDPVENFMTTQPPGYNRFHEITNRNFLENIIDTRLTGVLPHQNQIQLEREFAQHSRLSRVKPRSAIGWNNPIGFVVPTYLIRT